MIRRSTSLLFFVLLFPAVGARAQLLDRIALDTVRVYHSLEHALKEPDKVFALDLSRQKLKDLPEALFGLKHLNILRLEGNKLRQLPDRLAELSDLQVLDLKHNKLEDFPEVICSLRHLKRLDMARNALTGLPPCLGQLTELISLDLWSNDLATFPDSLSGMTSLRFMDLRVIQIEEKEQDRISELLPRAKIYFSAPCNCGM